MADYERLKWADDKRWTNNRKRDTCKALAEASYRNQHAEWLAEDEATAERLAAVKQSTAALYREFGTRDDVVDHLLPDGLAERAAYSRMESAAVAERSMREKLVRGQHLLDECRKRVANKTVRLARLKANLAEARKPAPVRHRRQPVELNSALMMDKKLDVLKLGNLQAAKARDIIAHNIAMRDALNEQLAADVRQQATAVVELLAYGTAAKQEAVAYNQDYCRVASEHKNFVHQNNAKRHILSTKISVLTLNRKKMIVNQMQNNSDEDVEFETGKTTPSFESNLEFETSNTVDNNNLMLLKDWIDTGQMEKQIFSKKENSKLSSSSDVTDLADNLTLSTGDYTFPEEKVNLFKFRKGESSRAEEAVEYVCETLNFSNITEVLHYFTSVKNVEMRIKKMISMRKDIFEVVQNNEESATEVKIKNVNCLPVAILKLDAKLEHVQREYLDVQKKQFEDVNRIILEYGKLFNELWFQLDSLVGKLERCQVPVVRKYQLNMKNRAKGSESTKDTLRMLDGLCLQQCSGAIEDCSTGHELPAVKSIDSAPGCRQVDVSGKNPAVDACRKLSDILYTKVKSCMVHIGGPFDAGDKNQLMARACFAYDRQTQFQWDVIASKGRKRRTQLQIPEEKVRTSTTDVRATGIMTRVQTKQQAKDIVQWSTTPKDTDDAKRTRKPISFRKSRIVVPERKKKK